jgi:hypothetical protein
VERREAKGSILFPLIYSFPMLLTARFEHRAGQRIAVGGAPSLVDVARKTIDASIMCYGLASPVYEMSSAPVRLKMSFARVTSSPFSVWIDSRMLPDRTFPS